MQQYSEQFTCFCNQSLLFGGKNDKDFINHFLGCKQFKENSPFASEFYQLSLKDVQSKYLYVLRAEFLGYLLKIEEELNRQNKLFNYNISQLVNKDIFIKNLDKKIKENQNNEMNNEEQKTDLQNGQSLTEIDSQSQNQNDKNDEQLFQEFMQQQEKEQSQLDFTQCNICKKKFDSQLQTDQIWFLQNCLHSYCKSCLKNQLDQEFIQKNGQLKCKVCTQNFLKEDYLCIQTVEQLEQLENKLLEQQCNIISCVKCKQKYDFQIGAPNSSVQDKQGNQLKGKHLNHYNQNRFVCPNNICKQEQCKSCGAVPYHLGYVCEEFQQFQKSLHCRYCNQMINQVDKKKPKAIQDICDEKECQQKVKNACLNILPCSHPCPGIKNEFNCLPCLIDNCKSKDKNASGDDYCNICFVEGLIQAPVIRSECGHYFHYDCIKKKLQIKWLTPRIVFSYAHCTVCKKWLSFPPESDLFELVDESQKLYNSIKAKSLQRLKAEERLKDDKLTDQNSAFYNNPQEYSLAIYSYYMCNKCKNPYFGGLKDCERQLNEEQKEYNPKDLICPNCCDIPVKNCQKHGQDFLEFKCRYCCSVAVWFCFGTTHFCDPCHMKAGSIQNNIPKCKGKKCPFKEKHNPNGQETPLGCSLCRNYKESGKEY